MAWQGERILSMQACQEEKVLFSDLGELFFPLCLSDFIWEMVILILPCWFHRAVLKAWWWWTNFGQVT